MFKKRGVISIFYKFHKSPYGGANQFLLALCREFRKKGFVVEYNRISRKSHACLFNSFNFDFQLLRDSKKSGCMMVHRIDGPFGIYRGTDDRIDREVLKINQEIAAATIFQSQYSYNEYLKMGFNFNSPRIIMNAADPTIFNKRERILFNPQRKIRIISNSWSDNPNKGAEVYKWLDDNLDWDKFEYTFVGRSQTEFSRIRMLAPLRSKSLAKLLHQHDIYIAASRYDPCSNALIEALACGLPAIYLKSGGHPEIVGEAGFGFSVKEDILGLLDRLVREYKYRQ